VKHRAFKLLLFLLAGAIINVAVAWGIAASRGSDIGKPQQGWTSEELTTWLITKHQSTGCELYRWQGAPWPHSAGTSKPIEDALRDAKAAQAQVRTDLVPKWGRMRLLQLTDEWDRRLRIVEGAFGWPMLAASCETEYWLTAHSNSASVTNVKNRAAIVLTEGAHTHLGDCLTLPLKPLWPGFAINTIFTLRLCGGCLRSPE
jgi:hypothetical protein